MRVWTDLVAVVVLLCLCGVGHLALCLLFEKIKDYIMGDIDDEKMDGDIQSKHNK